MFKLLNKINQIDNEKFWINSLIILFVIIIIYMTGMLFDSVNRTYAPVFFITFFISIFICLYQLMNEKNKEINELKNRVEEKTETVEENKTESDDAVENKPEPEEIKELNDSNNESEFLTEEEIKKLQGA